jgi:hypothetical protein
MLILVAVLLVAGSSLRNRASEPPPLPPEPRTGVQCSRAGGDQDYCRCLDRMEATRGRATPGLPPLDHPVIRYAMGHPRKYPIINSDTLSCLTPPDPPAPGVMAGMKPTAVS